MSAPNLEDEEIYRNLRFGNRNIFLENERRKGNLSIGNQNILTKLNKYVSENRYTAEKLAALYDKYGRFLSRHINEYIVNKPIDLQKEYYQQLVFAIFDLNRSIQQQFATQIEQESFKKLIDDLKTLSTNYIKIGGTLKPPPNELEPVAATAEIYQNAVSAEVVPDSSETRFAANTNLKNGGGFVSRIRSNISNLIERGFSNTNNNPSTSQIPVAKKLEPTPPEAVAVATRFIRPAVIRGGGGNPRIRDAEESKVDFSNLTGGGSASGGGGP